MTGAECKVMSFRALFARNLPPPILREIQSGRFLLVPHRNDITWARAQVVKSVPPVIKEDTSAGRNTGTLAIT